MNPFLPQPTKLELVHPTNGPTGSFLSLVGLESAQAQAQSRKISLDSRTLAEVANGNLDVATMRRINDEQLRIVAACVVGWDDKFAEHFGLFTAERAQEVFTMPEMNYAIEQITNFVKERKNFFR